MVSDFSRLGSDLNKEAKAFLTQANNAFDQINDKNEMMESNINDLGMKVDSNEEGIQRNAELLSEAVNHANMLAEQAMGLKDRVDR